MPGVGIFSTRQYHFGTSGRDNWGLDEMNYLQPSLCGQSLYRDGCVFLYFDGQSIIACYSCVDIGRLCFLPLAMACILSILLYIFILK